MPRPRAKARTKGVSVMAIKSDVATAANWTGVKNINVEQGRACARLGKLEAKDSENPTCGSGWIVQTQPTKEAGPFVEFHQRKLVEVSSPALLVTIEG